MKICSPLSWIGTVNRHRDQGTFHLVAEYPLHGVMMAGAACGARPFAYSGSFPDGHSAIFPRCQRCEAIAVAHIKKSCLSVGTMTPPCHPKAEMLFETIGGMRLKQDIGHGVMAFNTRCSKCGLPHWVLVGGHG